MSAAIFFHALRAIKDWFPIHFIDELTLSGFIQPRRIILGQHTCDPNQMLSILVYAYSQWVFSSRQIKRRCNEDFSFRYYWQEQRTELSSV